MAGIAVLIVVALSFAAAQDDAACNGRDGRVADPQYCDRWRACDDNQLAATRPCPAGTFFDGWKGCNHIRNVSCPMAPCGTGDLGRRYPSGVCCNKYFLCSVTGISTELCPQGQVFSQASSSCQAAVDPAAVCTGMDANYCDVVPPNRNSICPYQADPAGNPCHYYYGTVEMLVPYGTYWDGAACTVRALESLQQCDQFYKHLINAPLAATCTATFRATFDVGLGDVISERDGGAKVNVYSTSRGAAASAGVMTLAASDPEAYLYFYRFISSELQNPTAFRIRFRLKGSEGVTYDLASNSWAPQCAETLSVTARRVGGRTTVSATFVPSMGNVITVDATVDADAGALLEAMVVLGAASVRGELSLLQEGQPDAGARVTVATPTVEMAKGAMLSVNKCGIQLGRGPNTNLAGEIDDFAVFQYCQDVNQVLRGS